MDLQEIYITDKTHKLVLKTLLHEDLFIAAVSDVEKSTQDSRFHNGL